MSTIVPYKYIPNLDIRVLLDFKPSCIVYVGETPKSISKRIEEQKKIKH